MNHSTTGGTTPLGSPEDILRRARLVPASSSFPGPDALATGFTDSATLAMAVSAALSVVALLLVFLLPKRVEAHGSR